MLAVTRAAGGQRRGQGAKNVIRGNLQAHAPGCEAQAPAAAAGPFPERDECQQAIGLARQAGTACHSQPGKAASSAASPEETAQGHGREKVRTCQTEKEECPVLELAAIRHSKAPRGPEDQHYGAGRPTRACCRQDTQKPSYHMPAYFRCDLCPQVPPCLTICLWTSTPSRLLHLAGRPRLLFSLTQSAMTNLISRKFRNLPESSPSAKMTRTVPRRILSSPRSRRSSLPWLTFSPKEVMHLSFRIGGEHLGGKEECLGFLEAQCRKRSSSVSSCASRWMGSS